MPGWRNWYTLTTQNRLAARPWRFKSSPRHKMRGYYRSTTINQNKSLQSYVIGLALGDGNLSNSKGRAPRLRITCDKKYPLLIKRIVGSLSELLPQNKVSLVDRHASYLDVSVYSNHLKEIIPWKLGGGSKFVQGASVPEWIKENNLYAKQCVRGLIETDGSVYFDRKYKMVIFTTIIRKLADDLLEMMFSLGFSPHFYEIIGKKNKEYHVRLSKNVQEFIDLVGIEKS